MSQQPEAIRLAAICNLGHPLEDDVILIGPELRRLHAVELEAIALRAQVERLQAGGEWREVLEAVVREMPTRDSSDGNAPGHGHSIAGIWDSDNGALAGKPCAWCLTWNKAKRLVATPAPSPAPELPGMWDVSDLIGGETDSAPAAAVTEMVPVSAEKRRDLVTDWFDSSESEIRYALNLLDDYTAEFCRINGLTVGGRNGGGA